MTAGGKGRRQLVDRKRKSNERESRGKELEDEQKDEEVKRVMKRGTEEEIKMIKLRPKEGVKGRMIGKKTIEEDVRR